MNFPDTSALTDAEWAAWVATGTVNLSLPDGIATHVYVSEGHFFEICTDDYEGHAMVDNPSRLRHAIAALALAGQVAKRVREMLPEDTHFGLFILTPPQNGEGRIVAITSDRDVVAPQVAQWFLSVFPGKAQ